MNAAVDTTNSPIAAAWFLMKLPVAFTALTVAWYAVLTKCCALWSVCVIERLIDLISASVFLICASIHLSWALNLSSTLLTNELNGWTTCLSVHDSTLSQAWTPVFQRSSAVLEMKLDVASQASETSDVRSLHHPWPDGSVLSIGLSSTYANGLVAAEFGTGLGDAVSLFMNWPVAGLYQRAAMFTLPVVLSVQPDWYPS